MGERHPTGERVVRYIRDGHTNLAVRALRESVEGLKTLIAMDEDGDDELAQEADEEVMSEDKADLDKYGMLLKAIQEAEDK